MNATAPGAVDVVTGELVPVPAGDPQTIFHTQTPADTINAARQVAVELAQVISDSGMTTMIGRSEHVQIEGWQTLGVMVGISPYVVWSRPLENGWEARAEARTVDGRVVGAAEAMCTRDEHNWTRSDEYAIRSMAQTRAMSKALRGPLGFVMSLAGKSATPAEEVAPGGEPSAPEFPAWARHIDASDAGAAGLALVDIVKGLGAPDAARVVSRIGASIRDQCDGGIPRCVADAIAHIHLAIPTNLDETGWDGQA